MTRRDRDVELANAREQLGRGDWKRARKSFERALRLAERAFGGDATELVEPLLGLADSYARADVRDTRLADAAAEIQLRALEIARRRFAPGDRRLVEILDATAVNLRAAGRLFFAATLAQEAAALVLASTSPAGRVRWVLRNTCAALLELGRHDEALVHAEWAVRNMPSPPGPDAMVDLYHLGRCLHGVRRPSEAEEAFMRALEIRKTAPDGTPRGADAMSNELESWLDEARRVGRQPRVTE